MTEIKYGLISKVDALCLERTIDLICQEFDDVLLDITEVGIYSGETGDGIRQYVESKGRQLFKTGIDNDKDEEPIRFHYHKLIIGNSNEVYNQIPDNSQHMIIVDACHCFFSVVSDFMCYKNKVKPGGYILFHDVGVHLDKLSGWQGIGDKNDSDFCFGGVRRALIELGLFDNKFPGWEFVMEDADVSDLGGGMAVFRKK